MATRLSRWASASLVVFLAALAASWSWFDADEFVNIQQAVRANEGLDPYTQTPSSHPPLYALLLQPWVALVGDDLAAARLTSLAMTWAAGVLVADTFRRSGHPERGRTFLTLWTLNAYVLLLGTRAMNEAPSLLLLATAIWLLARGQAALGGAAAGLSVVGRFTAGLYVAALAAGWARRRPVFAAAAALTPVAAMAGYFILRPDVFEAFFETTIRYEATRPGEDSWRRIGKTLAWGQAPVFALLAWRRPVILDLSDPWRRAGAAAVGAGLLLPVALPVVHPHYFLPMMLVATAALVESFHRPARDGRDDRALILVLALLVPLALGVGYVPQTPNHDLNDSQQVADWIHANTPTGIRILTDAPQYAILADRTNYGGYYWSLAHVWQPAWFNVSLDAVSVVVVSERFGDYDRGFPKHFLETLEDMPCLGLPGAHVRWTGAAGQAPAGMDPDCLRPGAQP